MSFRTRRRLGMSRFVDLSAGVDHDGDEEEEEEGEASGEDDINENGEGEMDVDEDVDEDEDNHIEEDDELDNIELETRARRPPALPPEQEYDDSHEIAAAIEARWRGQVGPGGREGASVAGTWIGGKSEREHQMDLPHIEDAVVYSLKVKNGKEFLVVTRLLAKALQKKAEGISTIFCVPKAPGRIYIEGCAPTSDVRKLCHGMHFLYLSTLFVVPIEERVSLLTRTDTRVSFKKGDRVRIRTGLYRGDCGDVVDVTDGPVMLTIKLKSREIPPEEIGIEVSHGGTPSIGSTSTGIRTSLKRKRGERDSRPEPYVLPHDRLRRIAAAKQKELEDVTIGFEGLKVYIWSGQFKGKIGMVLLVSGSIARLSIESAMHARNILDVPTNRLLAECGCVLDGKEEIHWSMQDKAQIPDLFKPDLSTSPAPRLLESQTTCCQSIPPPGSIQSDYATPVPMHDPTDHGMWLFQKEIAKVRQDYDLVIRIYAHADATVSGVREGRVLREEHPLSHPIPANTVPCVKVKYLDGKLRERTDDLPAATLGPTSRLRTKGTHVVIGGKWMGLLVTHVHSEGETARVRAFGEDKQRKTFSVQKAKLCIVEK